VAHDPACGSLRGTLEPVVDVSPPQELTAQAAMRRTVERRLNAPAVITFLNI
jgi:hypothetical protein